MKFDPASILSDADVRTALRYMNLYQLRNPPVILAPDGEPYLYRWYIAHNNDAANVYFHIQVKSDPERPLHDHPWHNTSVILGGGYDETFRHAPWVNINADDCTRSLRKGDTLFRLATTAHRLILPPDIPYAMTLFSTGPKHREWGFWYPDGFHHNKRHVLNRNGMSVHEH